MGGRPDREHDLDKELRDHLDRLTADYVKGGLDEREARRRAMLEFGGIEQIKEGSRDVRPLHWLDVLAGDVRYALRACCRCPGFALSAIVTLALGIGGSTAVFTLVSATRTAMLPFADPDRLVQLSGTVMRAQLERRFASYPDFLDWRAQATSFTDMAAFDQQRLTLTGFAEPERIVVEFVSAPYFSLLGVAPMQGRTFQQDEDVVSNPSAVIVISDGLWRRRFGADPRIVGRTIALTGGPFKTYVVVGVMPPGFRGLTDGAELWVPFLQWAPAGIMTDRNQRWFAVLARLKPGVSVGGAQAEMTAIGARLEQAYPASNVKRGVEVTTIDRELLGRVRPVLFTLLGAVVLVLLIACANVANLLIARSQARRRELAVRRALGASAGRLLAQLMAETCVLSAAGALAGVALARLAVGLVVGYGPVPFPSYFAPDIDRRVAAFAVAVTLASGVLVSLLPWLQTRVATLLPSLKESARGATDRGKGLRHAVIVAEVSLAVVLLVGAGLLIKSVRNTIAMNPGFDYTGVLTLAVSVPRVEGASRPAVEGRVLLERVRAVPGVVAAGLGSDIPLDGNAVGVFYAVEGEPSTIDPQRRPRAYQHRVSPDFFKALRIPIVRGRAFTQADQVPASTSVIVSEALAARFGPGQDPIGRRLKFGALNSTNPWLSIVGVVGDVSYRRLPRNPDGDPDLYTPFLDRNSQVALAIRTAVPPASVASAVREAVRATDSSIAIYGLAPMTEMVAQQTSRIRFVTWSMGVFAAVALLLALVGLYGVLAYLVAQRTREIGVRLALGARSAAVVALVVRQSAAVVVVGLAIGLAGAAALTRAIEGMLFGLTRLDPGTFAGVGLIFVAAAIAASYVPARRATRIDPIVALRED